jgi:hypothetical protein
MAPLSRQTLNWRAPLLVEAPFDDVIAAAQWVLPSLVERGDCPDDELCCGLFHFKPSLQCRLLALFGPDAMSNLSP